MTRQDALEHFGVKGMRWGVRKDRSGTVDLAPKETKAPPPNVSTVAGATVVDISGKADPIKTGSILKPIGLTAGGVAIVGIGAAVAVAILSKNTNVKLPPIATYEAIPKAISNLKEASKKKNVYNLVSDKNVQRAAKTGKKLVEEVLIGNIGGISINDLKK
jgi:hypothetical protein